MKRFSHNLKFLAIISLVAFISPLVKADCDSSMWPVYAGGAKGSEDVRCFVHDPVNNLIITGGVTNSDDFAPAANDHAYLFALDLSGNWKWGSFFYNVSHAVSSIEGCALSSDAKSLTVTGIGNSEPIIMDFNLIDGSVNKFISFNSFESG